MTERNFTPAAPVGAVPEGTVHKVEITGKSVLLCHTQGRIFAVRNLCSHAEEALECGRMRSGWISCPAHGARFRLETGAPMNPPATEPIETYEVRIVDGVIEVAA
ncbi:non-heme iron oxygenase ferredoxin subunit [Croceicoccus sp. Ery5]|uniref:Rieske (2Fe-2S) protein n=1 Tax=Croceicoccus sp. Ery5 TaxID=1703340 RepID=UPI001E471292|nr:non-heme iron oxygenase ferredoxin subunit [Croceicoccus sp. Ery5]